MEAGLVNIKTGYRLKEIARPNHILLIQKLDPIDVRTVDLYDYTYQTWSRQALSDAITGTTVPVVAATHVVLW